MCGLYGFITKESNDRDYQIYKILGILTESRGNHATGVYAIKDNESYVAKEALAANEFFKIPEYYELIEDIKPNIMIGHNRFATHGSVDDNKNNHPFYNNRFGFVHNGVVHNGLHFKTKSECDSERIFVSIMNDTDDIIGSIKESMKYFNSGSYACILGDSQEGKVYLFKNDKNPLWIFTVKNSETIYWASTKTIIETTLKVLDIELNDIREIKDFNIITIDADLNIEKFKTGIKKYISLVETKGWQDYKSNFKYNDFKLSKKVLKQTETKKNEKYFKCEGCGKHYIDEHFYKLHVAKCKVNSLSFVIDSLTQNNETFVNNVPNLVY